jgi:metallophosphoesterase (TIGR00282 family)
MRIAFIGDIVGKPGRLLLKKYLKHLQQRFHIDFTIANYENASHGFGLTEKNCKELLEYGVDLLTGGNHSFDKKEIVNLFDSYPLIRPLNYPLEMPGKGTYKTEVLGKQVAIINLMGYYTMPMVDNPFTTIQKEITQLKSEGYHHILIDFHAEVTAEKQALLQLLKQEVSAIFGTHTHVGTDDLQIVDGCCYVTDVGLTGCRDGVIGMESQAPLKRFLTGVSSSFDIPKKCQTIFQMIVCELDAYGQAKEAQKVKIYDDKPFMISKAWVD